MIVSSPPRIGALASGFIGIVCLYYLLTSLSHFSLFDIEEEPIPLPGIEDVFVIVKTGSCEVAEKLPVHILTTLEQIPSWTVFSDVEEIVQGITVHNAFKDAINQRWLDSQDEFILYNKLQEKGACEYLSPGDNKAQYTKGENTGNYQNRGWNLDKWKYLPSMEKTWQMRPTAKWYLFVEPDTFVVWPNLLQWLKVFDPSEDHYLGFPMSIGPQLFAYGGAGSVMSRSAMEKAVHHYQTNRIAMEEYTAGHWAGDDVLGRTMQEAGVHLMWSTPEMSSDPVSELAYGEESYGKRLWCTAAVSYHHMSISETIDFWRWSKAWFREDPNRVLRQRDVFKEYVFPRLSEPREFWNNLSPREIRRFPLPETKEECAQACQDQDDCVQYLFIKGWCRTSDTIKFGRAADVTEGEEVYSGWMTERIEGFIKRQKECTPEEEGWRQGFFGPTD